MNFSGAFNIIGGVVDFPRIFGETPQVPQQSATLREFAKMTKQSRQNFDFYPSH